jgi:hypothetical protein
MKEGFVTCSVVATKSPIIFIGTGEHMSNFEAFDAKSFVTRLLGKFCPHFVNDMYTLPIMNFEPTLKAQLILNLLI